MDFLTVEEVAEKLGISVATVRRRCASGEIGAQKAGRQWLVDASVVSGIKARRKKAEPSDRQNLYDVDLAFRHVQSTDLSESWVPDVLRFKDAVDHASDITADAHRRLADVNFGAVERVLIPKTQFSNRPGVLLELPDRVAYQAVVASFAPKIEAKLADTVYSSRLSKNKKFFLEHGPRRWVRFDKAVAKKAEGGTGWVAKADLAAYFEHVVHDILFDELSMLGVSGPPLRALREMLSKWTHVRGVGLPQGPNASRVLGNFYLVEVDHAMLDAGYDYYRYMDDIRIFADSKPEAVEGLRHFEDLCRRRGLSVGSAKTTIHPAVDFVRGLEDKETDLASYFFDRADLPRARGALRKLLRGALKAKGVNIRRVRFSLWRLARIREASVLSAILQNLEILAPVASVVAAYLKHFVNRPSTQSGITEFMQDPARSYSEYLRAWIYASMLECKSIPSEWRKLADRQVRDRNAPSYLRAVAACVLAKSQVARDLTWMKAELLRERDPVMERAYLVALTYGRALDKGIISGLRSADDTKKLSAWLRGRSALPSLVYSEGEIRIP